MRKHEMIDELHEQRGDINRLNGESHLAAVRLDRLEERLKAEESAARIPDYKFHIQADTLITYNDDGSVASEKDAWRWSARTEKRQIGSGYTKTYEKAQAAVKAAVQEHFWTWLCDTTVKPSAGDRPEPTRSIFDFTRLAGLS